MNIALIGYGKMGHVIERIAVKRGHSIVCTFSSANANELTAERLERADVAIEFTNPESALSNVMACLDAGICVVSGTTGWNDSVPVVHAHLQGANVGFIHASNFSIGVNLFFELNKYLASLLQSHSEYKPLIVETHHTQKKDAPSGTAISLANQIISNNLDYRSWALQNDAAPGVIPVISHRIDPVPGTHTVSYRSEIDDIEITHTAHNRDGFALGAVMAAEYIYGKTGIFTMSDVLGVGK